MKEMDSIIVEAAQALKNDLAFAATMDYLRSVYADELFSTSPEQKEAREAIYHRVHALTDIQATLRVIAGKAEKGPNL